MNVNTPLNVLIVGEGPAGLTSAILAAQQGESVTLIKARETYTRNQVLFLKPSSLNLLKNIGINLNIEKINLNGSQQGLVKIKHLESALLEMVNQLGVKIIQGEFKSLNNKEAVVELKNQGEKSEISISYDLLIGADGAHSGVRTASDIKCKQIGKRTLATTCFIPSCAENNGIETFFKEFKDQSSSLRLIETKIGKFFMLHSKEPISEGGKEKIVQILEQENFQAAASQLTSYIEHKNGNSEGFIIENLGVSLQQVSSCINENKKVALIGDAVATGTFFLGRGANFAFDTALQTQELIKKIKAKDPLAYSSFDHSIQQLSNELIKSSQHLFVLTTFTIGDNA